MIIKFPEHDSIRTSRPPIIHLSLKLTAPIACLACHTSISASTLFSLNPGGRHVRRDEKTPHSI